MAITQFYLKYRRNFGRQPMFCMVAPHLIDSIEPSVALQRQYCLRNPVSREAQACASHSDHYVNSPTIEYAAKGINHAEGGWPKDIIFNDEEATTRYRRRVERDDDYVNAIMTLTPKFEHLIAQNNALDVYTHYFKDMPQSEPMEKHSITFLGSFKDPIEEGHKRPIGCIDWTYEDDSKLVVAYCNKAFSIFKPVNADHTCYVWDLKNMDEPIYEFLPPTACWQIACAPDSPDTIIGGLEDGRVCIFDIRASPEPVAINKIYLCHRDPVTALLYIKSRLNNEFFSGSTDGRCFWYDIRKISIPIDSLYMSVKLSPGETANPSNAEPVSVLQYDRGFPTKFYCGTETGLAVSVNRKGKSHSEIMSAIFEAHVGPVKAIHRSPCTSKMFITCGDFKVNIWSEDIKSSPIITGTSQRHQIQDVIWAPHRVSGYMSVGDDGKFCYWDVLRSLHKPVIAAVLAKCPLLKIKAHEEGGIIAVGDKKGSVHIISLSETLVISGERDKQLMLQTYDRETRREFRLETRVKEIRLKTKETEVDPQILIDEETQIKETEEEYRRIVLDEMRRSSIPLPPYTGPRTVFE